MRRLMRGSVLRPSATGICDIAVISCALSCAADCSVSLRARKSSLGPPAPPPPLAASRPLPGLHRRGQFQRTANMSMVTAAKRLVPLLDRVLVEKVVPPTVSAGGILLPDTTTKVNSGVVVATGPGAKTKDGTLIPCDVKDGDTVLLPEYGGTPIKLEGKEFLLYRNDDLLGILQE